MEFFEAQHSYLYQMNVCTFHYYLKKSIFIRLFGGTLYIPDWLYRLDVKQFYEALTICVLFRVIVPKLSTKKFKFFYSNLKWKTKLENYLVHQRAVRKLATIIYFQECLSNLKQYEYSCQIWQ